MVQFSLFYHFFAQNLFLYSDFKVGEMVDALYHAEGGRRWLPAMVEERPTPSQRKYRIAWYSRNPEGGFEAVWVNKELGDYAISLQPPNELRPLSKGTARQPRFAKQALPAGASKAWLYFSEPEETTAEDGMCFKPFSLFTKNAFFVLYSFFKEKEGVQVLLLRQGQQRRALWTRDQIFGKHHRPDAPFGRRSQ